MRKLILLIFLVQLLPFALAQEETTEDVGLLGFLPQMDFWTWALLILFIIIGVGVLGLAVWAVFQILGAKQSSQPYRDSYQQLVSVAKNNCPLTLKGRKFYLAPDISHAGVLKGIIEGYNCIKLVSSKKIYDLIVYNPIPFSVFNPASWFAHPVCALMNADKIKDDDGKDKLNPAGLPVYKYHSQLISDVKWYAIGTEKEGFFEFAVGDDFTPSKAMLETRVRTDLKESNILAKHLGQLMDRALYSNISVRGQQKLRDEIPLNK